MVYDFESDLDNPYTCNPVELGAVVVDPTNLEIISGSEFFSAIRPNGIDNLEIYIQEHYKALDWHSKVHSKTIQDILVEWKNAPEPKLVFKNFVDYVGKHHTKINTALWTAPIRCGFNIAGFDDIILHRWNEQWGILDPKTKRKKPIFAPYKLDIQDICFSWFENIPEPRSIGMDAIRDFLGIQSHTAHQALTDVMDEAKIIIRFLKFQRSLAKTEKFKNAFL